jgi:hypothetical protein
MVKKETDIIYVAVISLVLVMLFVQVGLVIADHVVNRTGTFTNVDEDAVNVFNISVNISSILEANITQVNITIPSSFTFAATTNGTDSTGTFSNTGNTLIWSNSSGYVINATDLIKYFWFNATPATPGVFNITVTSLNATGNVSSTNLTVTVNDTTAPATVVFASPVSGTNYTNSTTDLLMNVSVTDNGIIQAVIFNVTNGSGSQNATYTASNTSQTAWNVTLNSSHFAEGTYNITVWTNDTFGNTNSTAVSIVIFDRTVPNVTGFTTTVSNGNYSQIATLNVTVADERSGVGATSFNITNSSGVQVAYVAATNFTTTTAWVDYNTTDLTDGLFNITAYATDSAGNANFSEKIQVRLDNTPPSIAYSCSPDTVSLGGTVTCTCSPTDDGSGINTTATTKTPAINTEAAGEFTQTCLYADLAGNVRTKDATYTVNSGDPASSPGSGSVTTGYTKTYFKITKEFEELESVSQLLGAKQRIQIKIDGVKHHVGVKTLTATVATIEIASSPVQVELEVGEDAKVDVNDDGFYDIYVMLKAITNGKANVEMSYVNEEIPAPEEGEEASSVETTGDLVEPTPTPEPAADVEVEEVNYGWLMWLLVIVAILVIGYYIYNNNNGSKGNKKKKK